MLFAAVLFSARCLVPDDKYTENIKRVIMACKNCGTPESAVSARNGSVNNTGYSDNFFMCACPEKPGRPMKRPAIQFMAYKNTAKDLDDAVDIIKKKHPPLRPGEPAVVLYEVHAVDKDGNALEKIDHYDMILAVGGLNGEDPMVIPSLREIDSMIKRIAPSDDKIKEIVNTEIKSGTAKETIASIVSETVTTDPRIEQKITEVVKKIGAVMSWKDDSGNDGWDSEIDGE